MGKAKNDKKHSSHKQMFRQGACVVARQVHCLQRQHPTWGLVHNLAALPLAPC